VPSRYPSAAQKAQQHTQGPAKKTTPHIANAKARLTAQQFFAKVTEARQNLSGACGNFFPRFDRLKQRPPGSRRDHKGHKAIIHQQTPLTLN
jgi:hypothetical protein